jgi:hypothetical protein
VLIKDYIEAKSNIEIILRERGKIVGRRETHNIFVSVGEAWLAQLICGETSNYISQMGFGIGGSKQNNSLVDEPPLSTSYPTVGAHSQTDIDPLVTALERAVCISSSSVPITPGVDVWLKTVASPTHPSSNRTRFVCVLSEVEVSFGTFSIVPVSELGLFTSDKNPLIRTNQLVAYDTCAPIPKTTALELEIRWTVIF